MTAKLQCDPLPTTTPVVLFKRILQTNPKVPHMTQISIATKVDWHLEIIKEETKDMCIINRTILMASYIIFHHYHCHQVQEDPDFCQISVDHLRLTTLEIHLINTIMILIHMAFTADFRYLNFTMATDTSV